MEQFAYNWGVSANTTNTFKARLDKSYTIKILYTIFISGHRCRDAREPEVVTSFV